MVEERIKQALEKIPYGVAVVTVGRGGAENGLAVSWMSQVSFDPPLVMVAVAKLHYSEEFLRSTKTFVINLLGADQQKLAAHFARESVSGEDKLGQVAARPSAGGAAILEEARAWLGCEVVQIHSAGDHLLVIGRVEEGEVVNQSRALTSESGLRYRQSKPARTADQVQQ